VDEEEDPIAKSLKERPQTGARRESTKKDTEEKSKTVPKDRP